MSDDLKQYIAELDIQEFRLISGEHIIAEILQEYDDEYAIKDPLIIEKTQSMGNAYSEWFPLSEQQYFSLSKSHILTSSGITFDAKVFFCRLVTANNVKKSEANGKTADNNDLEMLANIVKLSAIANQGTVNHIEDELNESELITSFINDISGYKH